jgi:formylglycine-generating enzyme required for sulfatase activity
LRGGAFFDFRVFARCTFRDWDSPGDRDGYFGFRVVVSPIS